MITVAEIKKKSDRLYPKFLTSWLVGEPFFPRVLKVDKNLSSDFSEMSKELAELFSESKDRKGFGYSIQSRSVKTRSHGIQDMPESIVFETQEDYLRFINKGKEFNQFIESSKHIKQSIPRLTAWIELNPISVIDNVDHWEDLLKVCHWFLNHFKPDTFYIRELPITVHTKFIESNKWILRILLDELIPEKINKIEPEFEKRFHLKYDQPAVRFRFLRGSVNDSIIYKDITIPLDQFITNSIDCKRVFIVENKMNFLTFPEVTNSIANP